MKSFSIVRTVFLIIGLAFLAGAFYFYNEKRAFLKNAAVAEGTVIELIHSTSDNSKVYRPRVSFKTKTGREVQITSSLSTNPPSYKVGEKVDVFYDINEPNKANINGFASLWLGPLILGIFGTIFFLIGFFMILSSYLKQKKSQYLQQNGKPILTKFDKIVLNYDAEVNGRNPFNIYSQWLDPNTNEIYVFKSEDIWFNPEQFLEIQFIKVFIEPNNPKKYIMDISFLPKLKN